MRWEGVLEGDEYQPLGGRTKRTKSQKFCVVDSLFLSCCCLQLLSSRIRRSPLSIALERESSSTRSRKRRKRRSRLRLTAHFASRPATFRCALAMLVLMSCACIRHSDLRTLSLIFFRRSDALAISESLFKPQSLSCYLRPTDNVAGKSSEGVSRRESVEGEKSELS